MNPITHFLAGWAIANGTTKLTLRERTMVTLAGVVPDLDGLGVVWDLLSRSGGFTFYQRYHHVFGHNLLFGLVVAAAGALLAVRKRLVAALMLASFHLHLLGDIVGARGQEDDFWPVPYLWPFSDRGYFWSHQWPLNGWQNIVITMVLLLATFAWAVKRGYSPLEMVSARADQAFVRTLQSRFGS